ncbi:DUF4381 domain-containing protein [Candidatus Sororendozoicomonas aggregata]|uniref:DUF4381 domain-containing protein n=1 Tax=Candidatus Sororendozoicomonas aggregata TaxID=3073239 RepID=UPI002ED673F1
MDIQSALEQLRPNHLPAPVSIWPLAPGWWIVGGLSLVIIMLAMRFILSRWHKRRYRRRALSTLRKVVKAYEANGNKRQFAHDCNRLLKKVALQAYPRQNIASLNGDQWLVFLSQSSENPQFSDSAAAALGSDRFKPDHELNVDQLHTLTLSWIKKHHA